MAERSWYWGGIATGDAAQATYGAPYTDAAFSRAWMLALLTNTTTMGVVYHTDSPYSGNLAVTAPGGAIARVSPGVAIVGGRIYENTTNVDITVAGADATYYIILQSGRVAQTVRATYGSSAVMVQNDDYWEILLATVVKSGGVITGVTDNRTYTSNINTSTGGGATTGFALIEAKVISDVGGGIFDFTNIPQTYKNLTIQYSGRSLSSGGGLVNDEIAMTFNADAGANYRYYQQAWDTALSQWWLESSVAANYIQIGQIPCSTIAAGYVGSGTVTIYDYANTYFYRSTQGNSGTTNPSDTDLGIETGLYMSTATGISRVTLKTKSADNNPNQYFQQYSRMSLFGT